MYADIVPSPHCLFPFLSYLPLRRWCFVVSFPHLCFYCIRRALCNSTSSVHSLILSFHNKTMTSVSSIMRASLSGSVEFLILNGAGALVAHLGHWNDKLGADLSSCKLEASPLRLYIYIYHQIILTSQHRDSSLCLSACLSACIQIVCRTVHVFTLNKNEMMMMYIYSCCVFVFCINRTN